jgi:hypothetical protein
MTVFTMKRLRRSILLAGMAWPIGAAGAPFCLQSQSLPPQCIYVDAGQCQQEAFRQGGVCSANPDQLKLQAGIGQYCLVTSTLASQCIYPDRSSCTAEAIRQHGACTIAPGVAPGRSPDPFAAVGGL